MEQKQNILTNFGDELQILNEETLIEWVLGDINDPKYDYTRFGFRAIHFQLTLAQLNRFKNKKPSLFSVSQFYIESYLQRLMPLELGAFIGKDWPNEIKMCLGLAPALITCFWSDFIDEEVRTFLDNSSEQSIRF